MRSPCTSCVAGIPEKGAGYAQAHHDPLRGPSLSHRERTPRLRVGWTRRGTRRRAWWPWLRPWRAPLRAWWPWLHRAALGGVHLAVLESVLGPIWLPAGRRRSTPPGLCPTCPAYLVLLRESLGVLPLCATVPRRLATGLSNAAVGCGGMYACATIAHPFPAHLIRCGQTAIALR